MRIMGLSYPELIISIFPILLCLAGIAAVVLVVILLFRISRSLEQIAELQKEQTNIVQSLVASDMNMTGQQNEQR